MRTDTMGRRRWLIEEKRKLIELVEKGAPGVIIAEILDREPHSVYAFMSRYKIKVGELISEDKKKNIMGFRKGWGKWCNE